MEIRQHLVNAIILRNFTLFAGQLSAIDYGAHALSANSLYVESKLKQVEQIVREVLAKMDHQTTLMVVGLNGVRPDGSHGRASPEELNSVLFAYRKGGFPLKEVFKEEFVEMRDITSIMAGMLEVSIPFSNEGVTSLMFQSDATQMQ